MHLDALRTRSLPAAHLPVIRGIIDQLGIVDVLDAFCPRHPLSKVSDAECVVAMLLSAPLWSSLGPRRAVADGQVA